MPKPFPWCLTPISGSNVFTASLPRAATYFNVVILFTNLLRQLLCCVKEDKIKSFKKSCFEVRLKDYYNIILQAYRESLAQE